MNDFLIWGAKGHAKVLCELIHNQNLGRVVAFFDQNPAVHSFIPHVPIFHNKADFLSFLKNHTPQNPWAGAVAIGGQSGFVRLDYLQFFKENGVATPNLVHRSVVVLSFIPPDCGIQILAHATVGVEVDIQKAVIINSGVNVEHECVIEKGAHLSPSATLCGKVHIGKNAWVGANAVILPFLKVGENALIGAGSVVTRNIPANAVAKGNPARICQN